MNRQNKLRTIKSFIWIGVAADALWTVALVWPPLYGLLTGRAIDNPSLTLRLAMGIGASLMAGWTVLLIWAARAPVQRRIIMLFTAFPVVAGILCVSVTRALNDAAGTWLVFKCIFLAAAMLTGYYLSHTMAKEDADEIRH